MARKAPLGPQVDENGKAICGSQLSHPGAHGDYRCHRLPLRGKNRCKRHGTMEGVTGPAHPKYVHGGFAKALRERLPERMQEHFDVSMDGMADLSSEALIAMVDARLLDLLGKADVGVTADWLRELRSTWVTFQRAQKQQGFATPDDALAAAKVALDSLERLILRGAQDADVWEELGKTVDRAQRLRDAEHRRQIANKDMVKIEKLEHMNRRLIEIIAEEVDDPEKLRRIAFRMSAEG